MHTQQSNHYRVSETGHRRSFNRSHSQSRLYPSDEIIPNVKVYREGSASFLVDAESVERPENPTSPFQTIYKEEYLYSGVE